MLFGRRHRRHIFQHLREGLWPSAGWSRAAKYISHRVRRLPGSPYSIAAGFACGAAVSFTPFIGLHFLLGAVTALLIGGNLIASAIGTVVGNPWTFPFIWSWIYALGRWLQGEPAIADLPRAMSLHYIFDHPWEVLWPMVIGGLPTAVAAWLIAFWTCYKAVQRYQHRRRVRRQRKADRQSRTAPAPAAGERKAG